MAKKIKVLVVDDEDMLRGILRMELEIDGHEVYEACSGNEAMSLVAELKPNLIISDIRMPDGDGVDLLKYVKNIEGSKPFIFLVTGFANITRDEAIKLGAIDLINKPADMGIVLDFINNM